MLALLFAAAPAEAACGSGGEVAIAASDVQGAAGVLAAVTTGGHCQHVPCSDTTHNHVPGGCAGHSFVHAFAFEAPRVAIAKRCVAFADDTSNGRTLLPPVPPPLV